MMGTINCVYETPCGWCSKWDKECDKKISERGKRAKCNPIDDAIEDKAKEYLESVFTNKICKQESDHEWECTGISTTGTRYRCKKCYNTKTYPCNFNSEISITI